MSLIQKPTYEILLKEILMAPLGEVNNVLRKNLGCNIALDLIEQNTPKPGTEFERKITVSAEDLPLIRAVIKFDKKKIPSYIMRDLLQKREKIGTILKRYGIPNEKNIVFFRQNQNKIFRIYEIKINDKVGFEISEEIMCDHLRIIQR